MSSVSLIPDRQLTFSPELAETIGLEEAVLLQALGTLLENRQGWTTINLAQLQQTLSFWSTDHIARLIDKLVSLGILRQRPGESAGSVMLSALADETESVASMTALSPTPQHNMTWQPSAAVEELLSLNHGIPRQLSSALQHSSSLGRGERSIPSFDSLYSDDGASISKIKRREPRPLKSISRCPLAGTGCRARMLSIFCRRLGSILSLPSPCAPSSFFTGVSAAGHPRK